MASLSGLEGLGLGSKDFGLGLGYSWRIKWKANWKKEKKKLCLLSIGFGGTSWDNYHIPKSMLNTLDYPKP